METVTLSNRNHYFATRVESAPVNINKKGTLLAEKKIIGE